MADDERIIPPISPRTRRRGARDGMVAILMAGVVLLLCQGPSIRRSGERMDAGILRSTVLAVGVPAADVAEELPFADAAHTLTAWLSDDDAAGKPGAGALANRAGPATGEVEPVAAAAFAPADIGAPAPPRRPLRKLLVTGDSMAMPLDADMARRLGGDTIEVTRDPHVGSGISKSDLVDWGELSLEQSEGRRLDAVVVFIGANEGFPMKTPGGGEVECCGADWAAEYASRTRIVMNAYRRDGQARVYWLTLPHPRDDERAKVARVVNAAVRVAAQPYRRDVRVLDMASIFTPAGRYRDALPIAGKETLVREPDGIHLSDAGAGLAADEVMRVMAQDFDNVGG
jgi:hypothetical protein